jgi:hypothetical protein
MYIQQLRELTVPPTRNVEEPSKQITVLIPYQVSYRWVTLLKFV